MRFRKRSFHSARRPREPLDWDNTTPTLSAVNIAGTTQSVALFTPSSDYFTGKEDRLTLRRLILSTASSITFGAGAVGDVYQMGMGICKLGVGQAPPNPLLAAAADQQSDWLFLTNYQVGLSVAGAVVLFPGLPNSSFNVQNLQFAYDIKVGRRLEMEEYIALIIRRATTDQVNGTNRTATFNLQGVCRSLYQRTMRR